MLNLLAQFCTVKSFDHTAPPRGSSKSQCLLVPEVLQVEVDSEAKIVNILGIVDLGGEGDHHHIGQRLLHHHCQGARRVHGALDRDRLASELIAELEDSVPGTILRLVGELRSNPGIQVAHELRKSERRLKGGAGRVYLADISDVELLWSDTSRVAASVGARLGAIASRQNELEAARVSGGREQDLGSKIGHGSNGLSVGEGNGGELRRVSKSERRGARPGAWPQGWNRGSWWPPQPASGSSARRRKTDLGMSQRKVHARS